MQPLAFLSKINGQWIHFSYIEKERKQENVFYGWIRYYLYVHIANIRKYPEKYYHRKFSRKGSDWENDNWNSGSRNEHKRSLDSPIVPSVCFSAIVVSFCGDQCQYNSGYATNLLVARHLVFWRVILLLFFYRRGFTASKSSVRKVYLELSYWLRTDTV